jgi:hypothetical protein
MPPVPANATFEGTNRPALLEGLMMPAPPASGGAGVPATAATGHFHRQETRSWE